MKFLGLLGCFWSLVALGQEDRPETGDEPQEEVAVASTSQSATMPSPDEFRMPAHKRLYITTGILWGTGAILELSDGNLADRADAHLFSDEPIPPDERARQGLEFTTYSSEGLFLGSLVAIGQARYQKTKKVRSLYLSSASLMGYSWIQLLNAVAIGLGNDTAELPSATVASNGNAVAALGAASFSAFVLGQAIYKTVLLKREKQSQP